VRVVEQIDLATRAMYTMDDGQVFFVDRRGWIFHSDGHPASHPLVEEFIVAVVAWES